MYSNLLRDSELHNFPIFQPVLTSRTLFGASVRLEALSEASVSQLTLGLSPP
jgi:hypothetical protein